jgi:hypothetical protein
MPDFEKKSRRRKIYNTKKKKIKAKISPKLILTKTLSKKKEQTKMEYSLGFTERIKNRKKVQKFVSKFDDEISLEVPNKDSSLSKLLFDISQANFLREFDEERFFEGKLDEMQQFFPKNKKP